MNRWSGILACWLYCMQAALASDPAQVSIMPGVAHVDPGQICTVSVRVDRAIMLHGSSVVVSFDTTLIQAIAVSGGDVFTSPSGIMFVAPGTPLHTDSIIVDQVILGTGAAPDSGTLFTVRFTARRPGTALVHLRRLDLRDTQSHSLAVDPSDGQIVISPVVVRTKAFLQGPYSAGAMLTWLNTAGVIPFAQPYGGAPWSYPGTEAVASIPAGVVDWVLVELRTGTAAATKVSTRAAFVKTDGAVVDLDGTSPVAFSGVASGSYYIVLRHRNHLAVMSASAVALSSTSVLYDFTTGSDKYYGGDAKEVATGVYGLWAGDVAANGNVKYNLAGNDRLPVFQRVGGTNVNATVTGYYPEDVNMNGVVKYNLAGNDRLIIFQVVGGVNVNATRATKVPG